MRPSPVIDTQSCRAAVFGGDPKELIVVADKKNNGSGGGGGGGGGAYHEYSEHVPKPSRRIRYGLEGSPEFESIISLCCDTAADELWLLEEERQRVVVVQASTGQHLRICYGDTLPGAPPLTKPIPPAAAAAHPLQHVIDAESNAPKSFDPTAPAGYLVRPTSVAVSEELVFVACRGPHQPFRMEVRAIRSMCLLVYRVKNSVGFVRSECCLRFATTIKNRLISIQMIYPRRHRLPCISDTSIISRFIADN